MSGMRARVQRIARLTKAVERVKSAPAPAPEALQIDVIELVNWVYGDQRAHEVDGRGIGLHEGERAAEGLAHGIAGDGIHRLAEAKALGCRVDKVGYDRGELHTVAEAVHDLVVHNGGRMIWRYAEKKSTPPGGKIVARLGPNWKNEPRYSMQRCEDGSQRMLPLPGTFTEKIRPAPAAVVLSFGLRS